MSDQNLIERWESILVDQPDPDGRHRAVELAKRHAASEVQAFAQHIKDQGFCPDEAFVGHITDCHIEFTKET